MAQKWHLRHDKFLILERGHNHSKGFPHEDFQQILGVLAVVYESFIGGRNQAKKRGRTSVFVLPPILSSEN